MPDLTPDEELAIAGAATDELSMKGALQKGAMLEIEVVELFDLQRIRLEQHWQRALDQIEINEEATRIIELNNEQVPLVVEWMLHAAGLSTSLTWKRIQEELTTCEQLITRKMSDYERGRLHGMCTALRWTCGEVYQKPSNCVSRIMQPDAICECRHVFDEHGKNGGGFCCTDGCLCAWFRETTDPDV